MIFQMLVENINVNGVNANAWENWFFIFENGVNIVEGFQNKNLLSNVLTGNARSLPKNI